MRILATALSCLLSTSVAWAQSMPQRAASVFREVCADPVPSHKWIAEGENRAVARGWKVNKALWGRRFGTRGPDTPPAEAPLFDVRTWTLSDRDVPEGEISIWVVGPEWPMMKYNSCTVSMPGQSDDELIGKVGYELGFKVADAKQLFDTARGWIIEGPPKEAFGRTQFVGVRAQKLKTGWRSLVARVEIEIPESPLGLPHQNPGP